MTTELTAQGERQLESIAGATPNGKVIRAEKGTTGISEITTELRAQMKSEYAERVETVYADVYMYPLGLALLLLLIEAFVGEAPFRRFVPKRPPLPVRRAGVLMPDSPWAAHAGHAPDPTRGARVP